MSELLSRLTDQRKNEFILNETHTGLEILAIISDISQVFSGKKQLILNIASNNFESVVGYLAFMNANVAQILIESTDREGLYAAIIEQYKPNYIWCPMHMFGHVESVFEFHGYKLIALNSQSHSLNSELKVLLTTSGSTGSAKFVRLSEFNLVSNAKSIAEYLSLDSGSKAITTLPMSYSYGLSVINSILCSGGSIILSNYSVTQKEFWMLFEEYQANHFPGVPYTYEMINSFRLYPKFPEAQIQFTQAGGYLNRNVKERFLQFCEENNHKLLVMYGQTEATARMSYVPADNVREHMDSIGVPIPGGRFRIVDELGCDVGKFNLEGELVYEGPNVMMGYALGREDLALGDSMNGVLNTGDIARKTDDGFYYVLGRKKRIVKLHGNRISLDELERLCGSLTTECACIEGNGCILVLLAESWKEGMLKELILAKTLLQQRDFKILLVDKVIRNASGKIKYRDLEDRYVS